MIIAATIIFVGLLMHACINHHTLMKMREMDEECKHRLQSMQHKHEMEFARKQAELFRAKSN